MGAMALTLQPLIQRLARFAPMIAALIIAGGVTVVLAYIVLPAQNENDNTDPPERPTISAPTVAGTLEPTNTPRVLHTVAPTSDDADKDVAQVIDTPDD